VLTSGYLIQWQSEQVWLRWIFVREQRVEPKTIYETSS
jgi:hypothetical protein